MSNPSPFDPYAGNILIAGLGPLRSRQEVMAALAEIPKPPKNMAGIPPHVRLHMLMALRTLHLPSREGCRLHETVECAGLIPPDTSIGGIHLDEKYDQETKTNIQRGVQAASRADDSRAGLERD